MKYGYVKVGAVTPKIKVADVEYNTEQIISYIYEGKSKGIELLVFPELCLTGATCGDLFFSDILLLGALNSLNAIKEATKDYNALVMVGLPLKRNNLIYNVIACVNKGEVVAFIPQTVIYNVGEEAKSRYFSEPLSSDEINFFGKLVPFNQNVILREKNNSLFTVSAETFSDLNSPLAPSSMHTLAGALIIAGLSARPLTVGKDEYVCSLVSSHSAKTVCGYILASAGSGESTTDCVYGGVNMVAENGKILTKSKPFSEGITVGEIDLEYLSYKRSKLYNAQGLGVCSDYITVEFEAVSSLEDITRKYEKLPFVPCEEEIKERVDLILNIQSEGLKKRISHTNASCVVLGLSGGLDSTLAILVAVTAIKKLNRPLKDVVAVTMPCFGTTSRTYLNTIKLAKALGVTLRKIDISKSVTRHLKDIKHQEGKFDVTFENAQARERTQVLMDVANMNNGLVIGTGDLSESALGWATYNGDHMSMYSVNCTVPKTLVRSVVDNYANACKGKLKAVLLDILDTPVSPELLPAENDSINQKTEDIVGPYVLHDFFLFNMIRRGFSPLKLYFVAVKTFESEIDKQTILKWLKIFTKRFFAQQFKRSCVPDGVKVGSVALSPRGEWVMPSDAVCSLWVKELEHINQ